MGTREAPDGAPEAAGVFNPQKGLARVGVAKCFAVRHTPPAAHLIRRASPRGSTPFAAAPQRLRPVLTVPGSEVAGDKFGVSFLDDDAAGDGWDRLQGAPPRARSATTPAGVRATRQLLGWSNPLDEDPTSYPCAGQPSRLLLQLDSTDRYDLDQTRAAR